MGATAPNFADKTIWTGDNLDILRGINSECVDLIYLDPPFNSNRDYEAPIGSKAAGASFKDTWTLSDLDVAWMGLIADEQPAVAHTLKAPGFSHGKGMQSYLTMMAVRLLEMHRVLKDTGSIYLHCDPTAGHYLKQLMDAVFGHRNFRNEITWKRRYGAFSTVHTSNKFGVATDTILFYVKSEEAPFHPQFNMDDSQYQAYIAKAFSHVDENGRRYQSDNLANPSLRPNLIYEYKGYQPPNNGWAISKEKMAQWDEEGKLHFPASPTGRIRRKRFLDELEGKPVQNLWDDIKMVSSQATERIGYPTQKPLALLERIIAASSKAGDIVLDPFCGCATACVAAEKLDRQWVGIDISPKAVELVNMRLQQTMGSLFHHGYVTARTDIPKRTDIEKPKPYRQNKHVLFGEQEGLCNGCKGDFPFKLYEVDHLVPKSKGGTDHLGNLQLLCGHCNKIKGDKPQEHLIAQLKELAYA